LTNKSDSKNIWRAAGMPEPSEPATHILSTQAVSKIENNTHKNIEEKTVNLCLKFAEIRDFTKFLKFVKIHKNSFLPRDAMRKRGLCCHPVSVRPSRWCIVSTWLKIS